MTLTPYPLRQDRKPRAVWPAHLEHLTMSTITDRLEYLRGELRAERMSYGELSELQTLAKHIQPDDVELLEAAGVPEHPVTYTYTWTSSSGRINLTFADLDQCRRVSHPGPCDLDVAELSTEPEIAAQMVAIDPAYLARELREYGAWDDAELADHAQNLQRLLWIAGSDVHEQPETYADEVTP